MNDATFVDISVVEYVAMLFAHGLVGHGVTVRHNGSPKVWLFGDGHSYDWWWR